MQVLAIGRSSAHDSRVQTSGNGKYRLNRMDLFIVSLGLGWTAPYSSAYVSGGGEDERCSSDQKQVFRNGEYRIRTATEDGVDSVLGTRDHVFG